MRRLSAVLNLSIALGLFGAWAFGQTKQIPVPNCTFNFSFNAVGNTPAYANNATGTGGVQCTYWRLTYRANNFSPVSVVLQAANDANGAPSTFGTYQATAQGGTLVSGSNPNSSTTTGIIEVSGYAPWVRARLATGSGSGSVNGTAYGWLENPFGSSGGGGATTVTCSSTGCVVIGPTATGGAPTTAPVYIAGRDGAGNVLPLQACTLSAAFDSSSSGNTLLVAASGSKVVRICHWSGTAASAVDVNLQQGTGATCATSTAALSGLSLQVLAFAFDFGPESSLLGTAGNAVCLRLGAAVRVTGTISYAQY